MQKKNDSKILNLLDKVITLSRIIGIPQLINEINRIQEEYYKSPTIMDYTINLLLKTYSLSRNEFINGVSKKNKSRFLARAVFTDIASNVVGLQQSKIAKDYLKCSVQNVSKYQKYINELDTKLKQDNDVIMVIEEIKKSINKEFFNNGIKM